MLGNRVKFHFFNTNSGSSQGLSKLVIVAVNCLLILSLHFSIQETGKDQILAGVFWANVDLENQGFVYYRETTEFDLLDRATEDVRRVFVEFGNFRAKLLVIATGLDVGFYGETGGRKPVRCNIQLGPQCIENIRKPIHTLMGKHHQVILTFKYT